MLEEIYTEVTLRLLVSLVIGAFIGLERSYHSRPAGFRTYALVCLSTCLLMLVTTYEMYWLPSAALEYTRMDPTRMAQGIITGIGFLGAGVIMQQGVAVHGLTTAASILATAAIGILIGVGFYFPAFLAAFLILGILSFFKWLESKIPVQTYAYLSIRFMPHEKIPEAEIRYLAENQGFTVSNLNYRINNKEDFFEYSMVIRTNHVHHIGSLATTLSQNKLIREFIISPTPISN
ncbi:MgtC/SapB family protein [Candidatus Nitrosacidococcus sp. I8]|uniref:MgtC/SapB family protein n=1 Tax=Candidatus Nitrosacidococcus sp. I8 TaxID=2942908 RepID=UPI0022270441|nr:MgtC/SapB family protein [Candidatus Nitrosacidococcus sp. I8]CAH9018876.1 Protein SapB [Candidatus Nitrosacidococcus sp. I8]